MRMARQSKLKAKKQPTEETLKPVIQPVTQSQPDLSNIRDLIRSELLNHLGKPNHQNQNPKKNMKHRRK